MKIIHLYGSREGFGSYETFFDTKRFKDVSAAMEAKDCVVVDFLIDDSGIKYLQGYHYQHPDDKITTQLSWQNPLCGIDVADDAEAERMFTVLNEKYKGQK